jgi:MFS transporter, DHA2 family, multidrug resistance protein
MTGVISLATFMEILDVSIANVALGDISGNLGVSYEQGTWLVTTYLVSNAIIIPISGFLSRAIGRKRYFLISIALFTLSSIACALAPSLTFLLTARVLQGMGGGGLAPVEQSMIADSFPPEKRGLAFAAFGMVVVVGPIFGPTLGGWITDTLSWHWIFLINAPVGLFAFVVVSVIVVEAEPLQEDTRRLHERGLRIDWIGFVLMAVGIGALLVMLDRGQQEDWFASTTIRVLGLLALLGIVGMVFWELSHPDPIVPLPLLRNRNLALTTVMMMVLGLLVFGTIQLVPQLLQVVYGYPAFDAGLALTIGGLLAIVLMPIAGVLTSKLDLRMLLFPAFSMQALAFWYLSHFNVESTFWNAVTARFMMSLGLPFLFIPITNAAYIGLRPGEADKASAMLNFFRNLGGAFGISLCQTLLARRTQYHQDRITEGLNGLNPTFTDTLQTLTQSLGDRMQALAVLYAQVQRQAAMLSYDEVFHTLMLGVICILPFVLILRTDSGPTPGGGSVPVH